MTWTEYQNWVLTRINLERAKVTDVEPGATTALLGFIGLAGEAAEVLDLGKKIFLHGTVVPKEKIVEELGDVCWYLALLCSTYGVKLEDLLTINKAKLEKRDGKEGENFHTARGTAK